MTNPPPSSSCSFEVLKIVIYLFAGLILVVGLVAGISLMISAPHIVANMLIPFQLFGSQAISNAIGPTLTGFLTNLGVAVILVAMIISGLVAGLGLLVGRIAFLETRLARLEAQSRS